VNRRVAMHQTVFTIPNTFAGLPVFGPFGLLLGLWIVASIALVVWLVRRQGWSADTIGYLPTLLVGAAAIAFLLPKLADENGVAIRGYGVMLLVAVSSAVALSMYRAKQFGVDPEIILSLAFWLFVAGIVGARLFYVIEYWEERFKKPSLWETVEAVLNIPGGGLVVYGSLIGGGLALVVFVWRYKLPGLALADLIAPGLALGMAIGRIGCFFTGCCYGGVCDLPWAVTFPAESPPLYTPPYLQQLHNGQLFGVVFDASVKTGGDEGPPVIRRVYADSPAEKMGLAKGEKITSIDGKPVRTIAEAREGLYDALVARERVAIATDAQTQARFLDLSDRPARSRPVHPAQLYSAIDATLLCLFLLAYSPYRRRDGELAALMCTIHPISRFLLEMIRTDEAGVLNTGLSIGQTVSLIILAGAIVFTFYLWSRPRGLAWPAGAAS